MSNDDRLTKGERRENRRNKKRKMKVVGRSILTLQEVLEKKSKQAKKERPVKDYYWDFEGE